MAELKPISAAGSDDVEVFLSASDDEAVPQQAVTPELLSSLVKQVEFYFSDANLPTDKKLLKQIRKDPDGFVPVKLFANFRKVRALSKDVGIITEALRGATLLQLSADCKRVRRIMPVPEYDISDIQRRTIVVENLPGNPSPTIESVTDMFRLYGRVKLVRICSRESKGKLPSWLTGSCQNMGGLQHAYVEFEEEEGAILAAAALASESDAPDGAVQVRRLLACIAEQRERRSGLGNGSSYGGSTSGGGGCSRKGSRDVSPQPGGSSRGAGANNRRGSGGGAQSYGGSSYSCGGSSWGTTSVGGAGPEPHNPYHPPYHHHSYGGAYDHCGPPSGSMGPSSRRGSAGGSGGHMSPHYAHLPPPPPPPPPRRSCDSAPASDLLPPPSIPTPTLSARASNVYRPPAKRMSDGYTSTIVTCTTTANTGCAVPPLLPCSSPRMAPTVPSSGPTSSSVLLTRSLGGSFSSSYGGNACSAGGTSIAGASNLSTAPGSTSSTPVAMPSSPPLLLLPPPPPPPGCGPYGSYVCPQSGVTVVPHSPPLSARGVSIGGRPPVHPPVTVVSVSASVSQAGANQVGSALAEAIAQVQAERRASEAGAKAVVAALPAAPATPATISGTPSPAPSMVAPPPSPAPAPIAAAPAAQVTRASSGPTAPKFCLDLAAGPAPAHGQSRPTRASPANSQGDDSAGARGSAILASGPTTSLASVSSGEESSVLTGPPRSSQAQMVENVEDFINNILARPAARPIPGSGQSGSSRRAPLVVSAEHGAARGNAPTEAAAAVAGIIASTLRRGSKAGPGAPSAAPPVAISALRPATVEPSLAPAPVAAPRATVSITAFAAADVDQVDRAAMQLLTMDLNGKAAFMSAVKQPVGLHQQFQSTTGMVIVAAPAFVVPEQQQHPLSPVCEARAVAIAAPVTQSPSPSPAPISASPAGSVGGSAADGRGSGRNAKVAGNGSGSNGGNGPAGRASGPQPGSKRLSKREYALWAAATPGFRAEAASKYGTEGSRPAPGSPSPQSTSSAGAAAASSPAVVGGRGSACGFMVASSTADVTGSISSAAPVAFSGSTGPIWHVARGPDGSRGFAGRARASPAI